MSEFEANQLIHLIVGMVSGVCIVLFFLTSNVGFVATNFVLLKKVISGMTTYYSSAHKRKGGRELLVMALWRFV